MTDTVVGAEDVVRDVQSRNYGAAAGDVVDVAEQIQCTDDKGKATPDKPGCSPLDQDVYVFVRALAIYSIDSATTGDAGASADANFRKAAVTLIEAAGGAGIRRRLTNRLEWLYVPEFSLRDAWRPGHVWYGAGQLMVYPSVELLRTRVPFWNGEHFYLAAHGSLLDLIGPVMEGATRDPSLARDGNALAVFLPGLCRTARRSGIWSAGHYEKSCRRAWFGDALFSPEGLPGSAAYQVWMTTTGNKAITADNFEASVFVKYVP